MNKIYNPRKVAILMATYNGETYLAEQIESIVEQTSKEWTLYIQDDGSKDATVDIIKRYADDCRIVFVDRGLSHQGCCMNFMSLLNMVESDYYMFSDQDDVWFPNKIEITMSRMKEIEQQSPNKPIIIHTSRTFTDENLNVKLKSEFNPRGKSAESVAKKIELMKNPNILRIYTIVGGNTMMLNANVKDIVFPYYNVRVHDSVLAMAVASKGGIISTIIEPTIYYRLHSRQTCGVHSNKLLPKLLNIFGTISNNMRGYYIWKIYGGGNFLKFLYWRVRYFMILRLY